MSEEYVFCPATQEECQYKMCPAFNIEADNCGILLTVNALWNETKVKKNPFVRVKPSSAPDVNRLLQIEGIDSSELDINSDNTEVKPQRFLGDKWNPINEELKKQGYGWMSDAKESRWIHGYVAPPKPEQEKVEVTEELTEGTFVTIKGKLKTEVKVREVNTSDGRVSMTTKLWLDAGKYGDVNVTLWGDMGKIVDNVTKGDTVTLTGLRVGKPYKDSPQLSSTKNTTVE